MKYQHKEAFALMWYSCRCGHRERIWNSRDGVTPFGGLLCASCGGTGPDKRGLTHVDWQLDECAPDHKLVDGQHFFRDGTAADAVAIIERRIAIFGERGHPVPPDIAEQLREDARTQRDGSEWHKGWPMSDRFTAVTAGDPS